MDDAPRVWWPASPDAPVGRVWILPLTLWQTLWADLDTALDCQTDAWTLPRTPASRRRAVAEAAVAIVHRTTTTALVLAVIRLGPDSVPNGAGVWLLPDRELPSAQRAIDWLRGLRRAWDSGAPVAHDPPRLALVGADPAAGRVSAPVWTPSAVSG
ncbi:hypothetical protein [Embleya sp. MST-111070]|uniref:hypothetical protein n=1 Tax=Embleya sp. MST-111070 TaxID=3398231 RepID=UPI003F736E78